jgi:hypothetical protein
MFEDALPDSVKVWLAAAEPGHNFTRLVFGMGAVAFSNPCSRERIISMVKSRFPVHHELQDVLFGFKWHPEWAKA